MAGTGPASATGALELGFGGALLLAAALELALLAAEAPAEGAALVALAALAVGVPAD